MRSVGSTLLRAALWLVTGAVVVAVCLLGVGPSTTLHLAIAHSGIDLPYGLADILLYVLAGGFFLTAWGFRRVDLARVLVVLVTGISVVVAYATNEVLKRLFAQVRPCVELVVDPRCPGPDSWSFPSNHTTIAFALATAVVLMAVTRWAWIAYGVAACAAVSRVIDGVHFPHDVIAGAAVGTCVTICVVLLLMRATARVRRSLATPRSSSGTRMEGLREVD